MKKAIISCLGFCLLALSAAAVPDPASAYCEKNAGTSKLRVTPSGDEYGVCEFGEPLGCIGRGRCLKYGECGEWAFFRGDCRKFRLLYSGGFQCKWRP